MIIQLENAYLNFDAQASTPPDSRVIQAMLDVLQGEHANPHAGHFLGMKSHCLIDNAKNSIASLVGGFQENIIFTSSATEANNHVVVNVLERNDSSRKLILISSIEHKSVSEPIYYYSKKYGYEVKEIPVDEDGLIIINKYKDLLEEKPLLVSIISVNNEIGVIQDTKLLAELAHDSGAYFHCDAAQSAQAVDISEFVDYVDFLTISAHKFYGPQGIGAVYYSPRIESYMQPFIIGGSQQNGMRAGTLPTFLCVGMGKAAEIMLAEREKNQVILKDAYNYFINCLKKHSIEHYINGSVSRRFFGNLNIEFVGVDAEFLLNSLQPYINASTGSACNSGNIEPSKTLQAIGLNYEQAKSSVRFSFLKNISNEMIDFAVKQISLSIAEFKNSK